LFAVRKVGQRKTPFGQRKTLFSQRKIWLGFQENVFLLGYVCFPETTFQIFLCLFVIKKVGQRKTFFSQKENLACFQESVFLKNLGRKHFPEVVKKLKMSYNLLIVSNLVLKLLIVIYILF
jgi:hypothetical protein